MSTHTKHEIAAQVEAMLRRTGALLEGHFLLSSGLHSDRYCQCARLLEHPEMAGRCARLMSEQLGDAGAGVDVVLAPALGGVVWGYELARTLGKRSIFAERDETGTFALRRGFALHGGERVLIAEDVVTTGKSVGELSPLIECAGATLVGYASIVDRSGGGFTPGGGVPFWALTALKFQTWTQDSCPLCADGSTAIKPGSRPGAGKGR